MSTTIWTVSIAIAGTLLAAPIQAGAITIFSDTGVNAVAIQDTVDGYRAALGNPNNGNAPGPLATGRREINWDGGGPPVVNGTAPATPFVVFQNTRGGTFTTPGTGLTQAAATGGLLSLDTINPTYAALFASFSPNRLFAPVGSNITAGVFSIPGTGGATPAGVRGFGAVFSDVDLADVTTIEYFDTGGSSLGVFSVPATAGDQTFSFLGITTAGSEPLIGSFRITTGTTALGPGVNESPGVDLVVMDDFLYGEPQLVIEAVPQSGPVQLLGLGLLALAGLSWAAARRRSQS
jgi:hypothetical protein